MTVDNNTVESTASLHVPAVTHQPTSTPRTQTSMLPRRCSGVVMAAIHLVFSSDSAPPSPVRSLQFIRCTGRLRRLHSIGTGWSAVRDGEQILQNCQSNRSRRRGVSIEHYCLDKLGVHRTLLPTNKIHQHFTRTSSSFHPSSCKQTIIIHISTHCFYVFYSR
jgi:hypothetical protein